jgi:hypothetical protein
LVSQVSHPLEAGIQGKIIIRVLNCKNSADVCNEVLGSNADYFPFAEKNLNLPEYAATARERANKALETLGRLGWRPRPGFVEMRELFPTIKVLRPLLQTAAGIAEHLTEPGLVILEAPMGEGKTEAAVHLADRWAVAPGQRG